MYIVSDKDLNLIPCMQTDRLAKKLRFSTARAILLLIQVRIYVRILILVAWILTSLGLRFYVYYIYGQCMIYITVNNRQAETFRMFDFFPGILQKQRLNAQFLIALAHRNKLFSRQGCHVESLPSSVGLFIKAII